MKLSAKHLNRPSQFSRLNEGMPMIRQPVIVLIFIMLIFSFSAAAVTAEEPNVGLLRLYAFRTPSQVAPNSPFSASVDVEYALHGPDNATIKSAVYAGVINDSSPIWQSSPVVVTGGGDMIWNVSLTAPAAEGYLKLTAYAFYLDAGTWKFYDNSLNGPGFKEVTIKVAKTASLDVELGIPGISVSVGGTAVQTSATGEVRMILPVGTTYVLSVPSTVDFQNMTRAAFSSWDDGSNKTQTTVSLNGDLKVFGAYKTQYLLQVHSPVSSYSQWYDSGSEVSLETASSVPMNWPLSLLGLRYDFMGWSGDAQSSQSQLNITMGAPRTVNANYSINYSSSVIPAILAVGVVGAVILLMARRRSKILNQPAKDAAPSCGNCGKDVEEGWTFCIHCGKELSGAPPKDE